MCLVLAGFLSEGRSEAFLVDIQSDVCPFDLHGHVVIRIEFYYYMILDCLFFIFIIAMCVC